ncbi:34186_t:CDS:2, partial [Gigaspora margarita]
VELLLTSSIILELHYGLFAREWWFTSNIEEPVDGVQNYYPFRLGMKTITIINGKYFTITVHIVKDNKSFIPGFSCKCEEKSGKIYKNSTSAISFLYQQLFGTMTKFSGPLIMGFDSKSQSAVFTQGIEKTDCFINIYIDNQLFKHIEDVNPDTTWKQTKFLKQYKDNTLFRLEHYKKLRAWNSILKAMGCTNITPFNTHKSK